MDTQALRFVEENNCLRLLDADFGEPAKLALPVVSGTLADKVVVTSPDLLEDQLKDWLFVVTAGDAANWTFIVSGNQEGGRPGVNGNRCDVRFLFPMASALSITNGYFVAPGDYLIMSYTAAFNPIGSVDVQLGIDGYENLVEAWFRWKIEEERLAVSEETAYWRSCFENEMIRIRTETFNRVNKPRGRELHGFSGRFYRG